MRSRYSYDRRPHYDAIDDERGEEAMGRGGEWSQYLVIVEEHTWKEMAGKASRRSPTEAAMEK